MNNDRPYQNLIGLTEKEAVAILNKEDVDFRMIGDNFWTTTMNYVAGRVNCRIKNNKVSSVYVE